MTQYDVMINRNSGIDFAPVTEMDEILQNVRTILSTVAGSVPLDRAFGTESCVDQPMAKAQAMMASDILVKIRTYEPRVTVTSIEFEANTDGVLTPKVQVKINGVE